MQYPTLLIHTTQHPSTWIFTIVPFSTTLDNPDITVLTLQEKEASIGIDAIHSLQATLSLRPIQAAYKVGLIFPAELITLPAQNALLKTLEEPPENTQLILVTAYPDKLIETLRSRCRIMELPLTPMRSNPAEDIQVDSLTKLSVAAAILKADEQGKTKTDALQFLEEIIRTIKRLPTAQNLHILSEATNAYLLINRNVNARLVLEHFLFAMKQPNASKSA